MSFEVKSADVGKGVRLEYVEQGDPAGVPVVMLHGVTDSWRSFERVLPHLPPSVRAIAVTQRGHGDSSKPDTGYRTRDFAAGNAELLIALTRAVYRAQKWIAAHDGRALAEVVASYLPDVPRDVLAACCDEYKASGVWSVSPVVQRGGIEWKRDAMLSAGAIKKRLDYEDYVDSRFAEQALREDPPSI